MRRLALAALLVAAPVFAEGPAPARRVEISVTEKGFEPGRVAVKKGEPLELIVTRKTDDTCAKKLVVKDAGVKAVLPLNKAVTIHFTPGKTGEVTYACGMDMVTGVLVVE